MDAVLALPLVAVAFTGFAIGGVANAFNIIDGCNGLAAGTAVGVGLIDAHAGAFATSGAASQEPGDDPKRLKKALLLLPAASVLMAVVAFVM